MGQIFSNLTQSGTMDPATGSTNFQQPPPGMKVAAKPMGIGTPPVLNPQQVQPSFADATRMGATPGGANALSPALTKGGKLMTLLMSGLQGALAGHAASEQAVIQSGGHRAGGAGMGFEAGYTLPWQRAQQQAQTQEAQQQVQPFDTPYGSMPGWLAKSVYPSVIRGQTSVDVQRMKGDTAEDVQGQKSQTAENVANINKRFIVVPGVGVYDRAQVGEKGQPALIPGTSQTISITPEIAQDYGLPQEYVGKPMKLSDLESFKRTQIAAAPTVKTSTDPLGLTTTSRTTKQLPAPTLSNQSTSMPQLPSSGQPNVRLAQPRTATNTSRGTGAGGGVLDRQAQRLVEGDMDPSQLPKRGPSYSIVLDKANAYSQQKYGQPFDIAQASSDYQYARNPQTQNTLKMINGMTEKNGAIDIATNAAKNLPQFDEATANKIFNRAATEFGSTAASNFHTAMLGLADEYSKVMGGGVSSDTGRDQALSLLRASYSKGQLAGAVDIMRQDISARKSALIGNNRYLMKQYGGQQASSAPKASGGAAKPPSGATHIAPGSDGHNHYTNSIGTDLGIAP